MRYIPPLQASGKLQMAIDGWLLQQHQQGKQSPCLRFYTWSSPAISLGYHQRRYPEEWEKLGIDIVRRPTGGRAVLHGGDLTYMIVTSGMKGRVMEVYEYLCRFLIEGMRSLKIELSYGRGGKEYIDNPNCLAIATGADLITPDGQKLIGSALLKRGNYYLQHGSIQLNPDINLYSQIFGKPEKIYPPINCETEMLIQSLLEAAQKCFETELVTQPLSQAELDIIC